MEAIEIRNLKKIYKDFTLNIDRLDIKSGFVTGLQDLMDQEKQLQSIP